MTIYGVSGSDHIPLTPASGAAHSDDFKVTTVSGSAGWAPYLHEVKVDKGKLQMPYGRYTVGRCVVTLADFRLETDNAERWVTAFVGDAKKKNRLLGRKAYVEETLDGGTTWTPLFFGRTTGVNLSGALMMTFSLSEETVFIKDVEVFKPNNKPDDVDGVTFHRVTIYPIGMDSELTHGISIFPPVAPVLCNIEKKGTGTVQIAIPRFEFSNYNEREAIFASLPQKGSAAGYTNTEEWWQGQPRVAIYNTANVKLGEAVLVEAIVRENKDDPRIWVMNLPTDHKDYYNVVGMSLYQQLKIVIMKPGDGYYMTADTNYDVLKALLDGSIGDSVLAQHLGYSSANFTAMENLQASSSFQPFLAKIDRKWKAQEFIENVLLHPYLLGYAMTHNDAYSELKLFSLAIPDSIDGLATITGSDLVAGETPRWEAHKPYSFDFSRRVDEFRRFYKNDWFNIDNAAEVIYNSRVDTSGTYIDADAMTDPIVEPIQISGVGFHKVVPPSNNAWNIDLFEIARMFWATDYHKSPWNYVNRFGVNVHEVTLVCRRTDTVNALELGDWVLVDIEFLPDPNTHQRGGVRLMQVYGKNERGVTCQVNLMDGGLTTALSTPTVTAATESISNVNITTTATTDAYHNIEYVVLPRGTTSVSVTDQRWAFADTKPITSGSSEVIELKNLPRGSRVYGRARAQRPLEGGLQLPSPWTVSNGVDITAVPTPTINAADNVTYYSAEISWTNADTDLKTEVWSTGNEAGSLQRWSTEREGTDRIVLTGLDDSPVTGIVAAIRHIDDFNGASYFVSSSFNRGSGVNQAPSMSGIFVFLPDLFSGA